MHSLMGGPRRWGSKLAAGSGGAGLGWRAGHPRAAGRTRQRAGHPCARGGWESRSVLSCLPWTPGRPALCCLLALMPVSARSVASCSPLHLFCFLFISTLLKITSHILMRLDKFMYLRNHHYIQFLEYFRHLQNSFPFAAHRPAF